MIRSEKSSGEARQTGNDSLDSDGVAISKIEEQEDNFEGNPDRDFESTKRQPVGSEPDELDLI